MISWMIPADMRPEDTRDMRPEREDSEKLEHVVDSEKLEHVEHGGHLRSGEGLPRSGRRALLYGRCFFTV